jgi:hypothetical protein
MWNPFRKLLEPQDVQSELLELTIKAARRCTHDFAHAVDDIWDAERQKQWRARAQMWGGIFYPAAGYKDYRHRLHRDIGALEIEIDRLKAVCREHGINPDDPDGTPF